MKARQQLYRNLAGSLPDAHAFVLERIASVIEKYLNAFGLVNAVDVLEE